MPQGDERRMEWRAVYWLRVTPCAVSSYSGRLRARRLDTFGAYQWVDRRVPSGLVVSLGG